MIFGVFLYSRMPNKYLLAGISIHKTTIFSTIGKIATRRFNCELDNITANLRAISQKLSFK